MLQSHFKPNVCQLICLEISQITDPLSDPLTSLQLPPERICASDRCQMKRAAPTGLCRVGAVCLGEGRGGRASFPRVLLLVGTPPPVVELLAIGLLTPPKNAHRPPRLFHHVHDGVEHLARDIDTFSCLFQLVFFLLLSCQKRKHQNTRDNVLRVTRVLAVTPRCGRRYEKLHFTLVVYQQPRAAVTSVCGLTWSRCLHSSAHSLSVSLWSTGSSRYPPLVPD